MRGEESQSRGLSGPIPWQAGGNFVGLSACHLGLAPTLKGGSYLAVCGLLPDGGGKLSSPQEGARLLEALELCVNASKK